MNARMFGLACIDAGLPVQRRHLRLAGLAPVLGHKLRHQLVLDVCFDVITAGREHIHDLVTEALDLETLAVRARYPPQAEAPGPRAARPP